MKNVKIYFISVLMFFVYSCDDMNKMSNQISKISDTQNQILLQQDKIIKSLLALDKKVAGINTASNNKPKEQKKRKTPDPNFVHNIEIGNSVVLGNPDAKVTITKFTDFQ